MKDDDNGQGTCFSCKWFVPQYHWIRSRDITASIGMGSCRYYPPKAAVGFPDVSEGDFCSKFATKLKDKEDNHD